MRIEVLDKDDQVIGFTDNKLAVKKQNGEVEIFIIEYDKNQIPRIMNETIIIGYKKRKNKSISNKKNNIEYGTF